MGVSARGGSGSLASDTRPPSGTGGTGRFLSRSLLASDMNDPVLLTGAGGRVGGAILDGLHERYDWTLLFHSQPAEEPDTEYLVGDVTRSEERRVGKECRL